MDKELVEITTEQDVKVVDSEIIETEVTVEGSEQNVVTEVAMEAIEVEPTEEIVIEMEETVGWTDGDSTSHYSLTGRSEPDQHPISAITGLRSELDEIERLKTVYSDKIGVASFYKWHNGAYDEFGYFVSLVPHTSEITICDGTDIFGVTVDGAMVGGFVGGQDEDTPRDNTYALVATSGLVDVRCESTVAEGDYVVSNAYGIATTTDSRCGYKVIAIEDKYGVNYAAISLDVQACTTDVMGQKIQYLEGRMDDAETNIAVVMNVANDAYNKSIESDSVSKEAVLKALEALAQANSAVDATDEMNTVLESVNNTAAQAKAIAESAVTEAESIRKEAYDTANNALSNVNDLIADLEPITQWEDPISGNTGAEYLTTYINDGLATKVEVQTVEKLTEDNKSVIEKNAESISMMVSSVDKYSVGEYSQAYGLTLEQARNILKEGMVYIPIKHGDVSTHIETYSDDVDYSFTYTFYYVWTNDMWSEGVGKVWFGTEQPAGDVYIYWYDGDKLYLLEDEEWTEVATLAGNVNNRITSMIRQDVDEVRAEVVNAYGAVAGFGAKLSDTDAKVNSIASWPIDGGTHNMAVLESKADDSGSYMVLAAVTDVDGEPEVTELGGAKIVLEDSTLGPCIKISADNIVMDGTTTFVTPGDLSTSGQTQIHGGNIITQTIDADRINVTDLKAFGATIAGWKINDNELSYQDTDSNIEVGLSPGKGGTYNTNQNLSLVLYAGTKATNEVKAIAGTWRFNENFEDASTLRMLNATISFEFSGWFRAASGWVKYKDEPAKLVFKNTYVSGTAESVPFDLDITLTVDGLGRTLYTSEWDVVYQKRTTADYFSAYLLNREIGFGSTGIDTVISTYAYSGSTQIDFLTDILQPNATFLPGTIGLYPSMLDTEGRLYVEEARISGEMIDVDICAAGNIIINDGAIVYGQGWHSEDGVYLGKEGISVGEHFSINLSATTPGVSASSIIVGNATTGFTEGTVTCKVLNATDSVDSETITASTVDATTSVTCPTLDATNVHANNIYADAVDSYAIRGTTLLLEPDTSKVAYFQSDADYVYWSMILRNSKQSEVTGAWQGININCKTETLTNDDAYVLTIGQTLSSNGHGSDAKFKVTADGRLINPYITEGRFYFWLADQEERVFLDILDDIGTDAHVQLAGLWKDAGGSLTVTSDARAKHDIESLDERYDVFFDNLEARRFKYNVGTSDRYHLGYTTQGVQEALATAEIPEKEFAGVVTLNQGTENEESALRYYEFVSLNTDQIQKLKKRVDTLEAKNAELEERLAKLEALLNNNAE